MALGGSPLVTCPTWVSYPINSIIESKFGYRNEEFYIPAILNVLHNASPVTPINSWQNCTEGV